MPYLIRFFAIFALSTHLSYSSAVATVANFLGLNSGTWLEKIIITSTNDMNFHNDPDHPKDSGPNSAKVAFVFCSDEKLKDELKKMTGPDFIKNMAQFKSKYATSVYIVTDEVVPSENKELKIEPKSDDTNGQKVYNDTKFVIAYVSYQTPGDHCIEIPITEQSVTLLFGPKDMSVQQNNAK